MFHLLPFGRRYLFFRSCLPSARTCTAFVFLTRSLSFLSLALAWTLVFLTRSLSFWAVLWLQLLCFFDTFFIFLSLVLAWTLGCCWHCPRLLIFTMAASLMIQFTCLPDVLNGILSCILLFVDARVLFVFFIGGFCCCLNCVSLFNYLFFSHQDFWRLLLNVSHGGALASRDVRLGGASAPTVGSLGGAAGRFNFERATSDSTLLYLIVYFRFSLAVAELSLPTSLLAWRPSTRRSVIF